MARKATRDGRTVYIPENAPDKFFYKLSKAKRYESSGSSTWFERPGAKDEQRSLMRGEPPKRTSSASRTAPKRTPKRTPSPKRTSGAAPTPKRGRGPGPPKGVLLANKWGGKSDVSGWWASDKLDGMRAYWDGQTFWTRNGNEVAVPEWFLDAMPSMVLDGELYMGPGRFQDTMSVVRKQTARDPRWKDVRYHVFDAPEVPGGFEARNKALQSVRSPVIVVVKQQRVKSAADVERLLESAERRGVEGVMLREPGSRYERKRSRSLLKVKSFGSSEAKITGHTEGTGKHRGRLGAYEVVSVKSGPDGIKPGVRFKIGTGISDRERDRPLRIGTVVTFTYQELTRAGVPRFPALVGAR